VAYLAREVPRWSTENNCYSCHNNGDAARALFLARHLSYPVPFQSLADTIAWLAAPDRWERNGGDGPSNDKRLARIQFAAALQAALDVGLIKDGRALSRAAEWIALDQKSDGSWLNDAGLSLGSPATYGTALATYMAREILAASDARRFAAQIDKADSWLGHVQIRSNVDAAAVLLAARDRSQPAWREQQERALARLRQGQSGDGGWGPFVTAPPEPYDTAVALLALRRFSHSPGIQEMVQRGRAFLIANQLPDGSWPETTRPAGAESYAQRISTTGWATLALLQTAAQAK
jgi:squalene cyclase